MLDHRGLEIFQIEPTGREVSVAGRPALSTPFAGMPAYESETGALLVMESLAVWEGSASHPPLALPLSYGMVVARTAGGRDGLAALHDDPEAIWSWRPIGYFLGATGTRRFGSQQELEYRRGIWDAQLQGSDDTDALFRLVTEQVERTRRLYGRALDPGEMRKNHRKRCYREYEALVAARGTPLLPFAQANIRARDLLLACLAPQQRIELLASGWFFVRGEVNRLYQVEPGNGFAICDPVTLEPKVSLCLHPEEWMPHDDVALATKLSIDSGRQGEAELLEAANPRLLRSWLRPSEGDRVAAKLEARFRLRP